MRAIVSAVLLTFLTACGGPAQRSGPAGFTDVVWKVAGSNAAAAGALYVFLSEGTLVIARSGDRPMIGAWTHADGRLIMVEDGISYPTDILALTADKFTIRSNNPGEPVVIDLVRAQQDR